MEWCHTGIAGEVFSLGSSPAGRFPLRAAMIASGSFINPRFVPINRNIQYIDGPGCPEHFVPMDALARALRTRARELGLSHAAIARRIGMSERRYAHYVNGRNEPDLATLVRIAKALQTSPNELLGFAVETKRSKRTLLRDRLSAAASAMDDRQLEMTVVQAEAIAAS